MNNTGHISKISLVIFLLTMFWYHAFAQLPSYVPADSLKGWWSFSGNANDGSTSGINGAVVNASLSANKYGASSNAYLFNGTNCWINLGDNPLLNPGTSDMTISAWIKTTSTAGARIYSKGTHGGSQPGVDIMIYPSSGGKAAAIYCPGIVGSAPYEKIAYSNSAVNDGQWHMITGVINRSGTIQLYIDGVLQADQKNISATSSANIGSGTYNASIGASYSFLGSPNSPNEFFNGNIDEVGVWKRALNTCEINELYSEGNFSSVRKNNSIISANTANALYQWLDCDNALAPVSGASSQTYQANVSGNYALKITKNGCTDTSVCIAVNNKMITSYEYWIDNDYAGVIRTGITPSKNFQLSTIISTTGLQDGIHIVHHRFKDDGGMVSETNSSFFLKVPVNLLTGNNITKYEYWLDNDYASRVIQNVSPAANLNLISNLSFSSVTDGVHIFHVRFMDAADQWSSTVSSFFQKFPPLNTGANQITDYEYWFDNNYAGRTTQQISPSASVNIMNAMNVIGLPDGAHTYNIRFKDERGKWSSTSTSFFLKSTPETISNSITSYEYWFDDNYAGRVTEQLIPGQQVQITNNINVGAISDGAHIIHFRFADTLAKFSSSVSQFFIKNTTSANVVTAYKYWFDEADSSAVPVQSAATPIANINNTISMISIPKGAHAFHIQFKDSLQQWSSVTTDSVYKNPLPIASFSPDNVMLCDSGIVNFTNLSIDGDITTWNFGDGNTDTIYQASHNYTVPGTYAVSLTVTDTASGLDSTQLVEIKINPSYHISQQTQICRGDSIMLGGSYQNNTGTYIDSLVTQTGCDSIYITTLQVNELPTVTYNELNDSTCLDYSTFGLTPGLPNGGSYSGQGVTGFDFDPLSAGIGTWEIIYSYTDGNGCLNTDTSSIFVDPCIGLSENTSDESINIYPNPSSGLITVRCSSRSFNKIIISDALGRKVKEQTADAPLTLLDLRDQAEGVYYLSLISEEKEIDVVKIVLMK